MTTANRAVIGRQDLKLWDGTSDKTFSRKSTLGGRDVLNCVGFDVDVLTVFGGGTDYTESAINKAMARIGSTNKRRLVLNPGTWTISANVTVTSNLTLCCPPGVTISVGSGYTLTIQGPIEAGPYQIFSGSGTVTISGVQIIHDQWADGSGDAYYPSTDDSIDLGKSSNQFKDGYFDGTVYADALSMGGNISVETDITYDIGSTTSGFNKVYGAPMVVRVFDENGTTVHEAPIDMILSSNGEVQFI